MSLRWNIAQAAEIRWWQSYLGKKKPDEYIEWKAQYWHNFLDEIAVGILPNSNILDAGCGPAGIFMVLSDANVVAIDPLLDQYRDKLETFNIDAYPRVEFKTLRIEDINEFGVFDKVFCLNAINHVQNIQQSIDRVIQSIRPGGQLVLSIDSHNWRFWKHLFRALPGDILHPHQYDLEEYKTMVESRGCIVDRTVLMKHEYFFDYHVIVATRA